MQFQVLFHSPPGVLFNFPSQYWFTIGHYLVFSLAQWSALLPTRFHVPRRTQDSIKSVSCFRIRGFHPLSLTFPGNSTSSTSLYHGPTTPNHIRFGLLPFRSPLLRVSISLSSPPATKMFQFAGFALYNYLFIIQYIRIIVCGFPHSDTSGSLLISSSPKLFAGYRVLLRLIVPSHPLHALSNFYFTLLVISLKFALNLLLASFLRKNMSSYI